MSEPRAAAAEIEQVLPGVWHWHVHDDRIDFVSAGHAIAGEDGAVLIDPVRLEAAALAQLGPVDAVCLTAGTHQRSAWRYRRELGARVYAPSRAETLEEEPDFRYADGDALPGGLRAVFTPGAGTTQHTLLTDAEPRVAFVPDLLARPPGRRLEMTPAQYMHDPEEARRSVAKLLELPFSVLCLSHGAALVDDPKAAIRSVLGA